MERIVFLGDLHAGSYWAPWPERLTPPDRSFAPSRYLRECLEHYVSTVDGADLLVLMGDLIDGKQRKSDCTGVFTSSLGGQVEGATELLQPLSARCRRIVRVTGTPYHEDFHRALDALDVALGVSHAGQVLDLDIDGSILNVAHHPSGGTALYRGTKVDKEGLWATIAAASKKVRMPRWIVRAHLHEWICQETEQMTVVQTCCWQLPTPHATKLAHWRFQPSLGAVEMHRDDSHPGGWRFVPRLYDVPKGEPIDVNDLVEGAA